MDGIPLESSHIGATARRTNNIPITYRRAKAGLHREHADMALGFLWLPVMLGFLRDPAALGILWLPVGARVPPRCRRW
jgi:hypothetical protein